jgi:hypothetical protein
LEKLFTYYGLGWYGVGYLLLEGEAIPQELHPSFWLFLGPGFWKRTCIHPNFLEVLKVSNSSYLEVANVVRLF